MNQIERKLKEVQRETLGRVIPIPKKGSFLNKLGWYIAICGIIYLIWILTNTANT